MAGSGSDVADFLLGIPDASAIAFGNADKYLRQSVYDAYLNDDWRVNPQLTVNAGVRWEYGCAGDGDKEPVGEPGCRSGIFGD